MFKSKVVPTVLYRYILGFEYKRKEEDDLLVIKSLWMICGVRKVDYVKNDRKRCYKCNLIESAHQGVPKWF